MSKQIAIFENENFGKITTIMKDGEPWFLAKDVATILKYKRTEAMTRRLDEKDIGKLKISEYPIEGYSINSNDLTIINESGLYAAILGSKLPTAKKFKRWVTSEVLPSIRKTGEYKLNQEPQFKLPKNYLEALEQLVIEVRAKEEALGIIEEQTPKVEFFDQVANSSDTFDMNEAAKVLNLGIGRNQLFEFLRKEKILMGDNQPYQSMIRAGYFRVIEIKFEKEDGKIGVKPKTVVFQKGLDFIRRKYNKGN